jgi:hypothetical protein
MNKNTLRIRSLFKEMLEISNGIKDYNFRHYFLRRTHQEIQMWEFSEDDSVEEYVSQKLE